MPKLDSQDLYIWEINLGIIANPESKNARLITFYKDAVKEILDDYSQKRPHATPSEIANAILDLGNRIKLSSPQDKQVVFKAPELNHFTKDEAGKYQLKGEPVLTVTHEKRKIPDEKLDTVHIIPLNIQANRAAVGRFLGDKNNGDVLKAYTAKFDFKNKSIVEAINIFLRNFELPDEPELIDRILESFSKKYIAGLDIPIVQSYTITLVKEIIKLNSQLRSPAVKGVTTEKEFVEYVRNHTLNYFNEEYLRRTYNEVKGFTTAATIGQNVLTILLNDYTLNQDSKSFVPRGQVNEYVSDQYEFTAANKEMIDKYIANNIEILVKNLRSIGLNVPEGSIKSITIYGEPYKRICISSNVVNQLSKPDILKNIKQFMDQGRNRQLNAHERSKDLNFMFKEKSLFKYVTSILRTLPPRDPPAPLKIDEILQRNIKDLYYAKKEKKRDWIFFAKTAKEREAQIKFIQKFEDRILSFKKENVGLSPEEKAACALAMFQHFANHILKDRFQKKSLLQEVCLDQIKSIKEEYPNIILKSHKELMRKVLGQDFQTDTKKDKSSPYV